MDAVVDRDDRAARGQRRQDVVRRVEELHAFAPEIHRERELFRHRVRAGRLDNRAEPRAQRLDRVAIGAAAEHDVVVDGILAPELPQQVAHVRADAVVAKLAPSMAMRIRSHSSPFQARRKAETGPSIVLLVERQWLAR
jgi:hypothetical protein